MAVIPSRPAPGVSYVYAKIYGNGDQKEFSVGFWYSVSAGTIAPQIDGTVIGTAIFGALSGLWASIMADNVKLRGINCELSNGSLAVATDVYSEVPGAITDGTSLPEDVAVIVQKITGVSGKPGRGRWFFTQVDQSQADGSYLNGTGNSNFTAFAIELKTAVTVTGSTGPVTLSPAHFSRNLRALIPITNDPVVALLATKRKRRGPF